MVPKSISMSQFKAFATLQTLHLRPLTLIFGENNVGKSAALRLLALMADSLSLDLKGVFDANSEALMGASLPALLWKGIKDEQDKDFRLRIEWGDSSSSSTVYECHISPSWKQTKRPAVTRFSLKSSDESLPDVNVEWNGQAEEVVQGPRTYRSVGEPNKHWEVGFRGFMPDVMRADDSNQELMQSLLPLRKSLRQVQWLTARRRPPERLFSAGTDPGRAISPWGEDAGRVLLFNEDIRKLVSDFYMKHYQREVYIEPLGGHELASVMLRDPVRPAFDVNLMDCGEGVIQSFSVLVALGLSLNQQAGGIVAIEEPESHLHPEMQRALGEFICETLASQSQHNGCLIMETHSQHLLLAVQIAVARGHLRPQDVAIHWVRQQERQSTIELIELDEDGRPDSPVFMKAFRADTQMNRALIQARMQRETDARQD